MENKKLQKAAMKFARAWAKWHENSHCWLDEDVIDAGHGILQAMGLEMVETDKGKMRLTPTQGAE